MALKEAVQFAQSKKFVLDAEWDKSHWSEWCMLILNLQIKVLFWKS